MPYGHSITLETVPPASAPPDILFHGTEIDTLDDILRLGLQPLTRGFGHLTSGSDYALLVCSSKPTGSILRVKARRAHDQVVVLRRATEHVWLADSVPPSFIEVGRLTELLSQVLRTDSELRQP